MEGDISAILMAAGLSRRMGEKDKLLLEYKGKTLLAYALELLERLPCCEKIFVSSAQRFESIALPKNVRAIINHSPHLGKSESMRLGLQAATGKHYLFLNADQPLLSLAELEPLFGLASENPSCIIYPTIDGSPCTPVLFPACFRGQLLAQTGDIGGRAVLKAHRESCLTFYPERPENFVDIDRLEDYHQLLYLR